MIEDNTVESSVTAARVVAPLPGGDPRTPHLHEEGQLVVALSGAVACRILGAYWAVPSGSALWIPGGVPHVGQVSVDAECYFLFIDMKVSQLPREACTMPLSPIAIALIQELSVEPHRRDARNRDLVITLLLDNLRRMPVQRTFFPVPTDERLKAIALALIDSPSDRRTVKQWADHFAMSERTLSRRIYGATGMSFGLWRRQLRIVVALRALSEGHSVQRISADLGYSDATAFITMFKQAVGMTPMKYLESQQAPTSGPGVPE
ncbi:AraC family transcriptional regulator [Burkholderia sp. IMCC1007]|uniref:AraC family transcriptional regulator n=1 Tax=Burkholderia sp. IMCC1007 TaxID=3004104 RepID=UPI0022B2F9E1|nr:AraC family transcriptional regulator [Burkholderia sp. IMCC1007]